MTSLFDQRKGPEPTGPGSSDLAVFLAVAFGLTWLILSPLALAGTGHIGAPVPSALHLFGGLGPLVAAVLASDRRGWRAAWVRSLARISPELGSWTVALGLPVLLLGIGLFVGSVVPRLAAGAAWGQRESLAQVILVSFAYAIPEEAGWRGYFLARLQGRMGALRAALVLGAVHVLWHLPMFFYRYPLTPGSVAGFAVSLLAGSVVLTHLFNRSGGSVPVVAAFHGTWNVTILLGARLSPALPSLMSVGLILMACAMAVRYGAETLADEAAVGLPPGASSRR